MIYALIYIDSILQINGVVEMSIIIKLFLKSYLLIIALVTCISTIWFLMELSKPKTKTQKALLKKHHTNKARD
jgi:hypothetical protein